MVNRRQLLLRAPQGGRGLRQRCAGQIAAAVGAAPEEIALTRGATEALQLLIGGYNKLGRATP